MSVMRVIKNKNYTVMSNVHLKDKSISLKAKGLLSIVLMLPDDWNYSVQGLVSICKENETAVKSTLKELKQSGYLVVEKLCSNESETKTFKYVYNFFENPEDSEELRKEIEEKEKNRSKSKSENPHIENLYMDNLHVDKGGPYKSTYIQSTNEQNTDKQSTTNINAFNSNELKDIINASVPDRTEDTPYLNMNNCTSDEIRHHYAIRCKRIAKKHNITDQKKIDDAASIIAYFCQKYFETFGEYHPVLSDRALERVFINFCFPPELLYEFEFTDFDSYKELIDRYFKTEYGKYQMSGVVPDYSISHFMSEQILISLCKNAFGIPHV